MVWGRRARETRTTRSPSCCGRTPPRAGARPAFRHKDFGLWQTWTWAEVYDETRAIAVGLIALGLDRGDTIAIVGANRPRLYWSMTAAQMIGAIPVPVYADSVADEIAAVLDHSEARVIVAQDQEQVDKILSVRDRLPRLRHLLYDEPRGLADYDEPGLHALEAIMAKGRAALADPGRGGRARPAHRRRQGRRPLGHPLHLRHDRPLEGRRAERRALDRRGARHRRLRQADRPRRGARLSAARLGRRPLPELRAGLRRRLLHGLPGKRRHRRQRPARDRPDLSFRPAAGVRGAAHPGADPHGGRERVQALALPALHGSRQALGREDRQRRTGPLRRAARLRARRPSDLRRRSRTRSASPASASPIPRAKRSAPISSPSIARSASI